jgi:hypothetical protein
MKLLFKTAFLAIAIIVISACSQVSKEAMDAVMKAREQALAMEAGVYAKDTFASAEVLFDRMNSEIEAKSFESAEQLALNAKKTFDTASIESQKIKDELSIRIPELAETAADSLQVVEESYAKNKATLKANKVDLNALVSDLQVLKNALVEAQNDGKSSKFMDAKVKIDGILAKLSEIGEMMKKALEK